MVLSLVVLLAAIFAVVVIVVGSYNRGGRGLHMCCRRDLLVTMIREGRSRDSELLSESRGSREGNGTATAASTQPAAPANSNE